MSSGWLLDFQEYSIDELLVLAQACVQRAEEQQLRRVGLPRRLRTLEQQLKAERETWALVEAELVLLRQGIGLLREEMGADP
jgi:hypothetical protein